MKVAAHAGPHGLEQGKDGETHGLFERLENIDKNRGSENADESNITEKV